MTIPSRFALLILFTSFCALITLAQTLSPDMPRLTNKEIVGMVKAGVSDEVIIAKIKVARCNFDTEPSVLAELKQRGISNQVLMAMVQAPYGAPAKVKEAERLAPESKDGKPNEESVNEGN